MKTQKQKDIAPVPSWIWVLLVVIPLLVYGRSLTFGYVMHDDDKMILENPVWQDGIRVADAFTTDAWFMQARIELYRPVQSISYMLDYALGGTSPGIYHAHNLILFIGGVLLLYLFLGQYVQKWVAFVGAAVYSVNLLTPHAAGWIAARGDLYLMVFGLGFLYQMARYCKKGIVINLWYAVGFFLMALFSKESAIALLPVAVIMMYFRKSGKWKGIDFAGLGLMAILFAVYYAMRSNAIADAGNLSVVAFFQNIRSLPEEIGKMFIPIGYSVMPGYTLLNTLTGVIVTASLGYFIWLKKPSNSILLTGAGILLFSLLPSMAYKPSFAGVAYDYLDHRAWFPFIGLWMILAACIAKVPAALKKPGSYIWIGIVCVYGVINAIHIGAYKDWEGYYENAIKTNPNSGLAFLNYGSMLRDAGKLEEALPYMEKGAALSPEYADAKVRLSEVYFKLGQYEKAVELADAALAKEPNNTSALQFKGSALGAGKKPIEAIEVFNKILSLDPNNAHAYFNQGLAYKESGQFDKAIASFTELIKIQPDFPNGYFERGFCYGNLGRFAEAKADMDANLKVNPDHGASYFFRGRSLEAMGQIADACRDWQKAAELGINEAQGFIQTKCSGM